ncbi:MAG: hypothetical protein Q4E74_05415 [Ruminococcus sp.]|nr:hypothetical protein [Ruminococcus sp.]
MKNIQFAKGNNGFDERQIAVRGRGFMLAYLTAMAVLALLTCLDEFTEYITPYGTFVVTAWVSLTVFTVYAVTHSAYDRINDTATGRRVFGVFGLCGAFVLVVSMMRKDKIGENFWANIFIGVFMLINCAVYFIYHARHRNDNDED